jgi:hypothetical protein
MLRIIMEQNYFQLDQQHYKETEGLTMGAPISTILAEAYLQHMEHEQLHPILMKYQIIGYFRYVNDILLICNQKETNIDESLAEFNKKRININVTIEKEQNNFPNFLDLTIHRKRTNLELYRKPTQTDVLIQNDSYHPYEHKISNINYLTNRMLTHPITKGAKEKELNIIPEILHSNEYNKNLCTSMKINTITTKTYTDNKKWSFSHTVERKYRKLQNSLKRNKQE